MYKVILALVLITILGCTAEPREDKSQRISQISFSGIEEENTPEELFVEYQKILVSIVSLYETYEYGYIDIFLQNPNPRSIEEIPDLFQKNENIIKERQIQIRLLDANTQIHSMESQGPVLELTKEFSEFVNAQFDDYENLKNRSYKKFKHEDDGEQGMYGVHHMFQRKNKQIAEQSVLILERFNDEINYGQLDQGSGPEVNISGILSIARTHLYKNIGWP